MSFLYQKNKNLCFLANVTNTTQIVKKKAKKI